jgi:hypothetical protein
MGKRIWKTRPRERHEPVFCRRAAAVLDQPWGTPAAVDVDWAAQDWEDLMPRLLLLAVARLARLRGVMPSAGEAEDFVNDAISKTMAGARVWNRATCTLFQHLAGVVVSDISHCLTSSERRLTVRAPRANGSTSWPPEVADGAPDQEHFAVWISEQRRLLDRLHRLDPLMGRMAELMLVHDLCETSELSPALELGPAEVANLRKRLKRAVRTYLLEGAS